jgi:hypothetical protein
MYLEISFIEIALDLAVSKDRGISRGAIPDRFLEMSRLGKHF